MIVLRLPPRAVAACLDDRQQRFGPQQVELAVGNGAPRELAGFRDAHAAIDHGGEQALEVVRASVAVKLGDVLTRERLWRAHRERENLIDTRTGRLARPADADVAVERTGFDAEGRRDDLDRAGPADANDAHTATALSGTAPPVVVGTGRFSSVVRSRRVSSIRLTRMGTCRSESENFALFCSMSPNVAMRIVSLMLETVTPS